ncbi:MAG: hypothetical protein WBB29_22755 [Geitlerinemataceae cyanobacterium]
MAIGVCQLGFEGLSLWETSSRSSQSLGLVSTHLGLVDRPLVILPRSLSSRADRDCNLAAATQEYPQ